MAVQLSATASGINPYGFLRIVLHPDGTLTRLDAYATVDDGITEQNSAVLTKDITLDPTKKTWLRIFRPRQLPPSFSSSSEKLPLVVYFHGGGFIVGGANWKLFHDFCVGMAVEFPALVVSVGYRLAPEHRLPTAYEDSVEALHWIKNQASSDGMNSEEWLRDLADFSRCFLVGTSAGGNIAFHVGLRALEVARELEPIKITGLILHDPFFGASERTKSELKLTNDPILPLAATDLMWNLSLPKGFDRDHVYCNPMKLDPAANQIGILGRCLVTGWGGDLLIDAQLEFMRLLEREGVSVVPFLQEEGYHAQEIFEPEKAPPLLKAIKDFIFNATL